MIFHVSSSQSGVGLTFFNQSRPEDHIELGIKDEHLDCVLVTGGVKRELSLFVDINRVSSCCFDLASLQGRVTCPLAMLEWQ